MSMNKTINVCLSCDDNYAKYAGVVVTSILCNALKDDDLHFYILDGGISEENKSNILSLKKFKDCEIKFVKVDESLFENFKGLITHKYISLPSYYRLNISSILPDVDKIIYLDCDVVVLRSLRTLFNVDMENHPVAGVLDVKEKMRKNNPTYVNTGLLVADLVCAKELNLSKKMFEYTKEHYSKITCGDQEIINEVCKGDIKLLDSRWNVQISNFVNRSDYTRNPYIIHYISKNKPWNYITYSYRRDLFFKYFQMTPWALRKKDVLKYRINGEFLGHIKYLLNKPFFLFRPKFWHALYSTYVEPLFEYKKPIIKDNTFIVWEPCSRSHSEVVPGFCKYLLDLGYNVSVIVHKDRIKEGLFSRFKDEHLFINKMSKKQTYHFFKKNNLEDVEGVLVTTVGKLCENSYYPDCYKTFNPETPKNKIYFVEHEVKYSVDEGVWKDDMITLRKVDYKGVKSVVVNPHYFGQVNITPKNDITNFVMVGAIKPYKKNDDTIIDAIMDLDNKGITNFKVTVIGKGHLKHVPQNIRKYFDIKGHLSFKKMYDELEKSDFLLTAYDKNNPKHQRYNTTGTSGNFQLVYGFLKPCVIVRDFAQINGFDDGNSVLYEGINDYTNAMIRCINMSKENYKTMQNNLKTYVDNLYQTSEQNFKNLIESRKANNDK